jgi:Flp pilus assembly protein TadD
VLFFARRYEEAIETLKRTIEAEPRFIVAHTDLGRVCTQSGRFDEAIAEFLEAARLSGSDPDLSPGLGYAYAFAGRREDAMRVLAKLEERAAHAHVSPHAIASIHLGLGETERALEWLERAYREHDRALAWLKVHPRLDPLRGDPRFEELVRKVGLAG